MQLTVIIGAEHEQSFVTDLAAGPRYAWLYDMPGRRIVSRDDHLVVVDDARELVDLVSKFCWEVEKAYRAFDARRRGRRRCFVWCLGENRSGLA